MKIEEIIENEDGSANVVFDEITDEERDVLLAKGFLYLMLISALDVTEDQFIRAVADLLAKKRTENSQYDNEVPGWEYHGAPV